MKFLFFDTETNGLPKDYKASYSDISNWPRVWQLAWILADENAQVLHEHATLIKPDGWEIPKEPFWLDRGNTTERCMAEGAHLDSVLDLFMEVKGQADILVAHNLNFDHRVLWAEIIRSGRQPRSGMHKICTMQSSTAYCKIPGKRGYKWPKLEELYQILFAKGFEGAHDALADIRATKDCFFELIRLGVITVPAGAITQTAT